MKNQEETNRSYFVLPDGGYAQAKDCLLVTVPESLDAEIDTVVNLLTDDNDPDTEDEVAQKLDEYKGCGLVVSRYGGFKGDFLTKEGEN